MQWAVNNGIIQKLFINNKNIIKPWGFETSDSFSFYSLETGGNNNEVIRSTVKTTENINEIRKIIKMKEGKWVLDIWEELDNSNQQIIRRHKLEVLEDSFMFDYVVRFRFKKKFIKKAIINNLEINHKGSNIYYQYPVDSVRLIGEDFDIEISVIESRLADKFSLYMYVRDFKDEWIVHARFMPKVWDKEVLKLCVWWYNKALPQKFADLLLKLPKVRQKIWLRSEQKPYKFPLTLLNPNSYPEVLLNKGDRLSLTTKFKLL